VRFYFSMGQLIWNMMQKLWGPLQDSAPVLHTECAFNQEDWR